VQKLIRIVEKKGYLTHRREGHSYVYSPTVSREVAGKQALKHAIKTFFGDSAPKAVSALLDSAKRELTEEDLKEVRALIKDAERKGR
jgi:predicted transcriptional regulator